MGMRLMMRLDEADRDEIRGEERRGMNVM